MTRGGERVRRLGVMEETARARERLAEMERVDKERAAARIEDETWKEGVVDLLLKDSRTCADSDGSTLYPAPACTQKQEKQDVEPERGTCVCGGSVCCFWSLVSLPDADIDTDVDIDIDIDCSTTRAHCGTAFVLAFGFAVQVGG